MQVNQSGISARAVAGRDLYHFAARENPFDILYQKIKEETSKCSEFKETVDILKRYIEPNRRDMRSLEQKLTDAELTQLINYASEVKEIFAKKLTESQYLRSAQEFYAQMLSKVRVDFNCKIYSRIGSIPKELISAEVTEKVVSPNFDILGDNPLNLTTEDVLGMIYYLTGNCHIDWK
ncbi:ABC-three component system protein [uncultured Desulfovibrio sp.]|uniref:ABC-three component system protein n=1 Tax=uncultured Desulfovibrio sp. TaxID=167968 RepID=UPI00286934CE|nr:ABC-three component system protein [uncultured Desulfovibrio sp.]